MSETEWWYRYDYYNGCVGISVTNVRYKVLRHTPKGVWLDMYGGQEKFVLKDARKRFACPTAEEAMVSFIARKKRQLKILTTQVQNIETALKIATGELPNNTPRLMRGIFHEFK